MSESALPDLILSASFNRARRISNVLSIILAIGFWLTAIGMALAVCVFGALIISPDVLDLAHGNIGIQLNGGTLHLEKLTQGERLYGLAALEFVTLPSLFIIYHARLIFRHFKAGEVFAAAPIEHIRKTGFWLMISVPINFIGQAFLDLASRSQHLKADFDAHPLWLIFGLGIYVAAYVMAEARRIADDHASIV